MRLISTHRQEILSKREGETNKYSQARGSIEEESESETVRSYWFVLDLFRILRLFGL